MAKLTLRYMSDGEDEGSAVELSVEKDILTVEDYFRQVLQLYADAQFKTTVGVTIYQAVNKTRMLAIDPTTDRGIYTLHNSD